MVVVIQYLRGLAAALVVYTHLDTQILRLSPDQGLPLANLGNWGVDIFFVISGFIMYVAAIDIDARPGDFLLRRVIRIVPLYWLLTGAIIAVAAVAPSLLSSTRLDPSHILASLLFLPWPNPAYAGYWPVLIPGWTLNYEMYFYATVAIGLLAPRGFRVAVTSAIVIGILAALQIGKPAGPIAFYGDDIVLEFLMGLLAGYLFKKTRPLGVPLGVVLIVASVCLVMWMATMTAVPRSIASGIPALMIVLGSLQLEARARQAVFRPALYLGDVSYSLYLTHVIALPMVTVVFMRLGADLGINAGLAYPVVASLWALLIAALVYRSVEKPVTRTLRIVTGERRALKPAPDGGPT